MILAGLPLLRKTCPHGLTLSPFRPQAGSVPSSLRLLSIALAALLCGLTLGCDPGGGSEEDASVEGEGGTPPRVDRDGDGLCDDTEARYGADPTLADTDSDGLPDRAEVLLGYNPSLPSSPERDQLIYLTEVPEGVATYPVEIVVNGRGESYAGAFDSLFINDPLGRVAGDFFAGAEAVAANPPHHVFEVETEAERFLEVDGRTLLLFEVRFAYGADSPHRCARAYPFRYFVRRIEDGRYVAVRTAALVVLPEGERPDSATWCPPIELCF